jgi:hypothetical protein
LIVSLVLDTKRTVALLRLFTQIVGFPLDEAAHGAAERHVTHPLEQVGRQRRIEGVRHAVEARDLPGTTVGESLRLHPLIEEEIVGAIGAVVGEIGVDREPGARRVASLKAALEATAVAIAAFRGQHVERVLFAPLEVRLEDVRGPVGVALPQVDVGGLIDEVEEDIVVQVEPPRPAVVRAHAELQVAARTMIEVEAEVILVVAPAVEHHAIFPLIHEREEPVGLAAVLCDVERVAREVAGIEELVDLIEVRARRVRPILNALEGGARYALLTWYPLAGCVGVGAGLVGQEEMLVRPVHGARERVGPVLGAQRELRRPLGQGVAAARANLNDARRRARPVQRGG